MKFRTAAALTLLMAAPVVGHQTTPYLRGLAADDDAAAPVMKKQQPQMALAEIPEPLAKPKMANNNNGDKPKVAAVMDAPKAQNDDNKPKAADAPAGGDVAVAADKPKAAAAATGDIPANWYEVDRTQGQSPDGLAGDGKSFTMTIGPDANAVKIHSTELYTGGRFEVRMKSASAMPGVITAIYLASGDGRKGDDATGKQDEIDFEFKGNAPTKAQTNVFLAGQEDLLLLDIGADTSAVAHDYAIEWDDATVKFYVDNAVVRTKKLDRPMAPLKLSMSVWTTMGGWPGLKAWAGDTVWDSRGNKPIIATFDVISMPTKQ